MPTLPPIHAVIFDMDGTLTVPVLDFARIKAEIGIAGATPILEAMMQMTPAQRTAAETILARHEADAAGRAELSPGAAQLLAHLAAERVPMALLTRNSRVSVQAFCARFAIAFDAVHTREDDGPTKPDPEPVRRLCRSMKAEPTGTLMVGDFLFDILAGQSAGCPTCLIHQGPRPDYADQADLVVQNLADLLNQIRFARRVEH